MSNLIVREASQEFLHAEAQDRVGICDHIVGLHLSSRGGLGEEFRPIWWHLMLSNRHSIILHTDLSVNCYSFTSSKKYTEAVASMVATPMDTVKACT